MAEAVVTKLRVLAESGRTIVATIHQPSSHVSNPIMTSFCVSYVQPTFLGYSL